jgi:hypothetical protein
VQRVVEELAVALLRRPGGGEVLRPAADAEPGAQPPAGEQVDGGDLLGEQDGIAPPSGVQNAREQPDAAGHRGRGTERDQRVEEVVDQAVDHPQGVKAEALAVLRPQADLQGRPSRDGDRQADSNLHGVLLRRRPVQERR